MEDNDTNFAKMPDAKGDTSPLLSHRAFPNNALPCPSTIESLLPVSTTEYYTKSCFGSLTAKTS